VGARSGRIQQVSDQNARDVAGYRVDHRDDHLTQVAVELERELGAAGPRTLGRARLLIDPGHQEPDPVIFRAIQSFAELAPVVPRLIGSAAVSLAAVALNGGCFVGAGLEIWDAAAGMLLAEERGRAVRWWRFAGDSSHHVLAGEPQLVHALQPVMPSFILAWRGKSASTSADELLGPSATILV
jgi:hypothetical protein